MQAIEFARSLQKSQPVYVDRGDNTDFFEIMCSWNYRPYLALSKDGTPIGVITASPDKIFVIEQSELIYRKRYVKFL